MEIGIDSFAAFLPEMDNRSAAGAMKSYYWAALPIILIRSQSHFSRPIEAVSSVTRRQTRFAIRTVMLLP